MTDNITLPRAVAEMMFNALLDRIHGRYAATQEDEIALAALDAALAEPDAKPEPVAKAWAEGYQQGVQDERTSEASIGIAGFGAKVEPARQNPYAALPAPEPPAKPEPATDEQVTEAYIKPDIDGRWRDFELGFRAAERFHGIRKEDA
jgi:hypothetical protein